jgi:hypothetical protein
MPPLAVLPYSTGAKYDALVDTLQEIAEQADCGTVLWTKPLSGRFHANSGKAVLDAYLHLRRWKWRGSSSKRRLNILLHVRETVQCSDKVLLASNVHVDHYFVEEDSAKLLQSVHFDFGGQQDCHPVFHVQICADPIQLDQKTAEELEFEFRIEADHVSCSRDTRIPTCDMTIASVLLCLAADHFAKPFFCQFRDKAVELQPQLPQPTFLILRESLAANLQHLSSSHWFAHTLTETVE